MSSASRLAEVAEKYIPQIINDPTPNKIEEDNNLKRFHVQSRVSKLSGISVSSVTHTAKGLKDTKYSMEKIVMIM
ncbi:hypothetical protein ACROYT_G031148 [Oculina patagonica]